MKNEKLAKFSELIVKLGVNLQKGEELYIQSPIECAPLARLVAEEGYKAGAKLVEIMYNDEKFTKVKYQYTATEVLCDIPKWRVEQSENIVRKKGCRVAIYSEDPEMLAEIDPVKIAEASKASSKAMHMMRAASMKNEIKWCVVSAPSSAWAKKMFPGESEEAAIEKQWDYIFKTMRLDEADPVAAWKEHQARLQARCAFLNEKQFKLFRYKNSIGTDLTVEMPKNYRFMGGSEESADGCEFTANMPTEEVFSAPHRFGANGKLVSAMPLCEDGKLIDGYFMEFKDGKIVNYGAEKGYDTLKGIIETDEGSHYLGEIAMVGFNNPIRNLNTLFYNTLFDENASCHFAIGEGYASCVAGGEKMEKDALIAAGVNDSLKHVDFMIGTRDLSIVGVMENGEEVAIMENGDFVI